MNREYYTSPAINALVAITEQLLCVSDPGTGNLNGLRIDVDTENGLDDDDWD